MTPTTAEDFPKYTQVGYDVLAPMIEHNSQRMRGDAA